MVARQYFLNSLFFGFAILIFSFVGCSRNQEIRWSTGPDGGNYFQSAQFTAELIREPLAKQGYALHLESSPGAFANMIKLGRQQADLAFSQFDVILYAAHHDKKMADYADRCQILLPFGEEAVHFFVRARSGNPNAPAMKQILTSLDVSKVFAGDFRSGSWVSAAIILKKFLNKDLPEKHSHGKISFAEQMDLLRSGVLDLVVVTLGWDSQQKNFLHSIPAKKMEGIGIIDFRGDTALLQELSSFYHLDVLPGYPWLGLAKSKIQTFYTKTYLLARSDANHDALRAFLTQVGFFPETRRVFRFGTGADQENLRHMIKDLPVHPELVKFAADELGMRQMK